MKRIFSGNPLFVIFFTIFVDMLGVGILIPVIPQLLANPGSSEYLLPASFSLKDGYIMLGFLTAAYPLAQFFATPILGQLSDKYGRKKVLFISLIGTCLSYLLFAIGILTRNIPLLFASRIFDGVTGGNIAVANAAVADISTHENRAKNFGLMGAAFGLGFILGPYLGGKLSDPAVFSSFNAATPFWFAAGLSLLNAISVLLIFPETLKTLKEHVKLDWTKSVVNIVHAYTSKSLRLLFTTVFLYQAGFSFFVSFFSVYLINRFGFTQGNIGDYFSYIGFCSALVQLFFIRHIMMKFREHKIIQISLLMQSIVMLAWFVPREAWQLFLIPPFFGFFNGLTYPSLTSLVSKTADNDIQGEALGINASVQALAQAIPSLLSGYIAASITPETPILIAAVFIFVAWLMFILFYKPNHFIQKS